MFRPYLSKKIFFFYEKNLPLRQIQRYKTLTAYIQVHTKDSIKINFKHKAMGMAPIVKLVPIQLYLH